MLSQRAVAAEPEEHEWTEASIDDETEWNDPSDWGTFADASGIKKMGGGTLTIGSGAAAGGAPLAHHFWLYEGGLTFGEGLHVAGDVFVGTDSVLTTAGANLLTGTVVVDGTLTLAGETQISSLEGAGSISAAAVQTLSVGSGSFSGSISGISLTKTTEGTLSLSGESISLDSVAVQGGSLALAHSSVFSSLTLAGNTGVELADGVRLTVGSVTNTAFAAGSVFRLAAGARSATLKFTNGLSIWSNGNNVHFETEAGVNVEVSGGELLLGGQGATHSIGGTLTHVGDMNVTGGGGKATTAYLKRGGSISGTLTINTNGILYLGQDLTIGSLSSNNTGDRFIRKDTAATGDVFLIFNSPSWTTVAGINAAYAPNSLEVEEDVGYGTASSVTLTAGGTIAHAFKLSGNNTVLTLSGSEQTYSFKSIVGDGAVSLSGGVLSLGSNSSVSSLTLAGNTGVELADGVRLTVGSVTNTAFAAGSVFRLAAGASSATLKFTNGLSIWSNGNNVHFETEAGVNVEVSGGELLLGGQGATHSIGGTLTHVGDMNVTGGGGKATTAYLKRGGSISGTLTINTNGILYLGQDLTIGSLASNNTGNRFIHKDSAATGDVFLIFNSPSWTTVAGINAAYSPNSLEVEEDVGYGTASSVTLTAGGTIAHAFKLSGNNTVLTLSGSEQTYSFKSIVGDGAVSLSGGVLSLGSNSSVSSLTLAGNTGVELADGVRLTVGSVTNTAFATGSVFRLAAGARSATLKFTNGLSIWSNGNNVHFETEAGVNVEVSGGELLLGGQGATHSIGGTLTHVGNMNVTGGGGKATTAYLKRGGSISGTLTINTNGILYLGQDLTIGSLASNNTGDRFIRKDTAATGDVFLIFNSPSWTTVAGINAAYAPNSLEVEEAVGYGTASSVTLTEGGTIEHEFKISGSDTVLTLSGEGEVYSFKSIVGDGLLQVEDGARLQLSGSSSLSNLTLNGRQTMDKGRENAATQLTLDSLTLGDGATLVIGANGLSTSEALIILNPGATVEGSSLALDLDEWTELSELLEDESEQYTFRLIEGLPEDAELDINNLSELSLEDGEGTWDADFVDGDLVFAHSSTAVPENPDTLYWAANADGTWAESDAENWAADNGESGSFAFASGKSVVFGSGAANKAVVVEGSVSVQDMSVESKYSFSGGSIEVLGTLTAKSGASASFGQAVTAAAVTLDRGGFVDPAASVRFEQAAQLGTLTTGTDATVSFEKSSTVATLSHSGKMELADGVTLTVSQMRSSTGSISGAGTLLLQSSTPWAASWYNLKISSSLVYDSDQTMVMNQTFSGPELTVRGGGSLTLMPGLTSAVTLTMESSTLLLKGDIKLKGGVTLTGENRIENASSFDSVYLRFDEGSGVHGNLSTENYDLSRVAGEGVGFGFSGEGTYSFTAGSGFGMDIYIEYGATIEFSGKGKVFTLNGTYLSGSGTLKVSDGATVRLPKIRGNFGPSDLVLGTYLLNGGTLEIGAAASSKANLTLGADSAMRFGGANSVFALGEVDFELHEHTLRLSGNGVFKTNPFSADSGGAITYADPKVDGAKIIVGDGFTGHGILYSRYASNVNLAVDVLCCYSETEQKLTGNITGGHALELEAAGGSLILSGSALDMGEVSIRNGALSITGSAAEQAVRVQQLSCAALSSLSVEGRTLHVVDGADGELGSLTLKNSTLKMGRGTQHQLTLRALTLSEAATLSLTSLSVYSESEDRALIRFGAGAKVKGELSLALNEWAGLPATLDAYAAAETVSFALFSGLSAWFGITDFGGWEYEDRLGGVWNVAFEAGNLVFTYTAPPELPEPPEPPAPPIVMGETLIWNGSDGTWQAGESTEEWTNADGEGAFAFAPGKSVIFGTLGQSKSIAVSGAVAVQDMLVAEGCDYRFSAGAEGELRVSGALQLEGALTLGVDTQVGGALTGGGSLVVDGAAVSFEQQVNRFDGSVTLRSGVLAVNGLTLRSGTLTLEGGALAVNAGGVVAKEIAVSGRVSLAGGKADAALMAERITGSGVLVNTAGNRNMLYGDLSGFRGVVEAAADAGWILQNSAVVSELGVNLAGDGAIYIAHTGGDTLALTGSITGNLSIVNDMGVDTTLILHEATARGELVFNSNTILLGTADRAGAWGGSVLKGAGELVLVHGTLGAALTELGEVRVHVAADGAVDMGGTASSAIRDIAIHGEQGGRLSGVVGDVVAGGDGVRVKLRFGEQNISNEVGKGEYLLSTSGNLVVKSMGEGGLELSFTSAALKEILESHRIRDYKSALHIISGGQLVLAGPAGWDEALADTNEWLLLSSLGFNVVGAEGGDLVLAGSSMDVYLALNEWEGEADAKSRSHEVTEYGVLSAYKATVVDEAVTLTVTVGKLPAGSSDADVQKDIAAGGLLVNNLVGVKGATFHGRKAAGVAGPVTIVLNNAGIDGAVDEPGLDHAGELGVEDVRKQNTLFEGAILGDKDVNYVKTGAGTLTVGDGAGSGGLRLEGALILRNGGITVQGDDKSRVNTLIFDYEEGATMSGLAVAKGASLAVRSVAEAGAGGGELRLEEGAQLSLLSGSELRHTAIRGDGSATLLIRSEDAGGLKLAGSSSMAGVIAAVEGALTVTEGATVSRTTLALEEGSSLSVSSGAALQDTELSIAATAAATLSDGAEIRGEGGITLAGKLSLSTGSRIELGPQSELSIRSTGVLTVGDSSGASRITTEGAALVEGVLDLGSSVGNSLGGLIGSGKLIGGAGCELAIAGSSEFSGTLAGSPVSARARSAAGEATLTVAGSLNLAGAKSAAPAWRVHVLRGGSLAVDVQQDAQDLNLNLTLESQAALKYRFSADGDVRLRGNLAVQGKADLSVELNGGLKPAGDIPLGLTLTEGELSNLNFTLEGAIGRALDGVLKKYDDNSLYIGEVQKSTDCIFTVSSGQGNALAGMNMLWEATEQAWATEGDLHDFWMAASQHSGAGETLDRPLAALAGASVSALGSALSRDIQRQLSAIRTHAMGMEGIPGSPRRLAFRMWMNGEGSYHKLDADGLAPGYSLNSWGGTVGVSLAESPRMTLGLALTAMYGDLKVQAPDTATGDLDTTYVSAYARISRGKWTHTVALSGGLADVSLERTVSLGGAGYTAKGKTDGYTAGALYEIGYTGYTNSEATFTVQPVFNLELRHGKLKGYSEGGSDAGLAVSDISTTALTFGLGARLRALLGMETLHCGMQLDGRALLKADTLDRRGKADNRLLHGSCTQRLESAEIGALGIELGGGISLPIARGSLFLDAAVELRRAYTTLDATLGYRLPF